MSRSISVTVFLGAVLAAVLPLTAGAGEPPSAKEEKVATIGSTAPKTYAAVGARLSLDAKGLPLKEVLDFLSTRSGMNIRTLDDATLELRVTLKLDNVTWRDMLLFIAEKYKLIVDTSRENAGIIVIKSPPKVTIDFPQPTDIRVVIDTIATQTDANLIVGPEIKGQVQLSLKDVPWEDALDMVVRTLKYVAVKDKFNTYRITTPETLSQSMETRIFRLSYIQPEGSRYIATIDTEFAEKAEAKSSSGGKEPISLLGVLKSMLDKGKVSYERRSNTLVITETPTTLEVMQKLIEKVDIPPKQVHLAIRMVELADSEGELLGVEWANGFTASLSGMAFDTAFPFIWDPHGTRRGVFAESFPGRYGLITTDGVLRRLDDPLTEVPDLGSPSLGRLDVTAMKAVLNFVKTRTSGSIIQAPSIIALDNEEATIHVGKNIRYAEYFTQSTEGGGLSSGYREASDSPIKEGVQVLVIPHVTGPDGNVMLTVIPKSESLDTGAGTGGFITFGAGATSISLPQTTQRIVVTKMLLRDGETGVIAGLKKTVSSVSEAKVPVLGDIPILGWLFRSRKKPAESNNRQNMMIFVTPTVIDLQKEMRIPAAVNEIRRDIAGPFFTYEEKLPDAAAEAVPAGTVSQ